MSSQENVFLIGEGDNYYQRNRLKMTDPAWIGHDPVLRLLRRRHVHARRALEIGCSTGWRCHALWVNDHTRCLGVEPSRKAIAAGRRLYPQVLFKRGTADHLPLAPHEQFDLVIVHFVLHWVSREALLRSIAEIDRVVAENGHLIISDFWPPRPTRVRYHHWLRSPVYTYKLDYAHLFASTGIYRPEGKIAFDYSTGQSQPPPRIENRGICTLLRKSSSRFYLHQNWPGKSKGAR